MAPKKVLITGVSGLVGGAIYLRLAERPDLYDLYGFSRRRVSSERVPEGQVLDMADDKFFVGTVEDMEAVQRAVQGMDVVIHMAATWHDWEGILQHNLIGAYNIFEASSQAGVGRVIAASTIQVSDGNRQFEPYRSIANAEYDKVPEQFDKLTVETAAGPTNLYSASKVWAESLARTYATKNDMSCICIRIGWVVAEDRPPNAKAIDIWCSQRDIAQLAQCCVDAPDDVRFDIFYGMSNNKRLWVDIENARKKVGFAPQDRGEERID